MTHPTSAEELRRELRRLGYLEARVERFLGGASDERASFPLVLLALRVALVAGPLLALLLFAFAVVGEPTLIIDGPSAAYRLFLLLAGEVHILWLAALIIVAAGRRAQSPRAKEWCAAAGAFVCAAYPLAVWWHVRAALPDPLDRWIGDGISLLASAAFCLLMRRFLRTALGLVRLAPPRGPRGWRVQWSAAGACLGLILLLPWHPFHAPPRAPSEFSALGSGARVVLVICDGLSRARHARSLEQGSLAALGERFRDGLLLPLDLGEQAATPPCVWTTLLTGRSPAEHGVRRFARARLPFSEGSWPAALGAALFPFTRPLRMTPLSAAERRVPNVCEIVAAKGYRVLSINNWCSAPADISARWLASDRAIRAALLGTALPAAQRAGELSPLAAQEAAAAPLAALAALPAGERRGAADGVVLDLALRMHAALGAPADLIVITLNGLDLLEMEGAAEARIDEQVRVLDRELARFLAALGPGFVEIVCGAGGAGAASADPAGFAWLRGAPLRSETAAYLASRQVAPLVLEILGFPRSREMVATPAGLLRDAFRERVPERVIETFGDRGREPTAALDAAEELHLEALRTLGYVRGASGE
ncbi:MAG: hypothetical protein L0Z55_05815 [Planctomycetes bacterium]|nr:hypothetical protein [Planctomycetota bacterium]